MSIEDGVQNLLRFEAMFRGVLDMVPELRTAGSVKALADQAQQKLDGLNKEIASREKERAEVVRQTETIRQDAAVARAEADVHRRSVDADCAKLKREAQQAVKAAEAEARKAAQAVANEVEGEIAGARAALSDAIGQLELRKEELASLNSQIDAAKAKLREALDANAALAAKLTNSN